MTSKDKEFLWGSAILKTLGLLAVCPCPFSATPASAQDKEFNLHLPNACDYDFREIFLITGIPPDLQSAVYNSSSIGNCPSVINTL
jgi:hypothetical protein